MQVALPHVTRIGKLAPPVVREGLSLSDGYVFS